MNIGVYKTCRGELAYVTQINGDRLSGIVAHSPEWASDRGYESRFIEMDWNRYGALSDFDHRPYTPGCLDSSSFRPFNANDEAFLATFVDDLA